MLEKRKAYANEPKKVSFLFQTAYFIAVVAIIFGYQQIIPETWLMILAATATNLVLTGIIWLLFPRYSLFGTKMSEQMRIKDKLVLEEMKKRKGKDTNH